jgi:phosphoribosylanthranilate isomerase
MGAMRPGEGRLAIVLSGGLTPDNVARAVELVRPFAVDVNSGVEVRPGKKDPDRLRRFIAEAKRA